MRGQVWTGELESAFKLLVRQMQTNSTGFLPPESIFAKVISIVKRM